MRHSNHFNICILWLRVFVKKCHRINLENFVSQQDPRNYKRTLFRCTIQLTRCFWVYAAAKRVLVQVHEIFKVWKIRNKKRSSTNLQTRDNLKHNRTCVTLQETINEIKLIGKKIEICQIDHTISTHGDTNALSISTMTKTKKQVI